jgi:F-type H+-transporting ATPase subunit b
MKNPVKNLSATLFLAGALALTSAPATVFAQETEHKGASHSESTEEKPGMELWKWANFAILAGILGYLISKNMGPLLATRSQQIQEGLAAGERAQADADARAAAVMAKLSGLDQAIAAMRSDARTEREREGSRLQRETASELARIQQNAAFEVESATKLARLSVQRAAARLAIELAEQKVRARMSSDVQSSLVQNFLGELETTTSAGKLS